MLKSERISVPGDTLEVWSPDRRSAPAGGAVRRVLLLNVTYEPLTTVGLRRAVVLVLGGKAEVVHHDAAGAGLHAASVALQTPSVLRLSRHAPIPSCPPLPP